VKNLHHLLSIKKRGSYGYTPNDGSDFSYLDTKSRQGKNNIKSVGFAGFAGSVNSRIVS